MTSALHDAMALTVVGDGVLTGDIPLGWDVGDRPHGGYLLALVAEAMASVLPQSDPVTIAASYLAVPAFGPAELRVETVRVGKRQSTASVSLVQDGVECVRATATFGTLPDSVPEQPAGPLRRPVLPPPEACLEPAVLTTAAGARIRLHERIGLRLGPDTGWVRDAPRGVAEIGGWLRLADGSPADPAALLVFSDGMPPSIFEATGRDVGHVPTLQLTTHLFARPRTAWVQGRFRTTVRNGSFVDEDGELWDADGNLLATTRQLGLLLG
ncbi:MAG: thioesterase family protein [Acidimicrobiales bacterium]